MIPVRPEQMAVSLGPGAMLTTRGGTRATRRAALDGIDAPLTLACLAEDFGLVRFAGSGPEPRWTRTDGGGTLCAQDVAQEFGRRLLEESGIREIPLEGEAVRLPVRHGGLLPEPLRGAQRLLSRMGLEPASLRGTSLANQARNLESASDAAVMGLYVALEATLAFSRPLRDLVPPSRFGAIQGSAFPGLDRLAEIYERARRGKDSLTYALQSALTESARGNYLNLLLPPLDFAEVKADRRALERILPPSLSEGEMPRTGGVNLAVSAACASGLYALYAARQALLRAGVPGEYPMDAVMVIGSDATFSPYGTAPLVAGFSRRAPCTVADMLFTLRERGKLPPRATGEDEGAEVAWEALPAELRREAMNASSAPFTRFAHGLVVAEAAAAIPWMNFRSAIEKGLWPSSRLLGIHVNAGEGGTSNLASMDQGIVTSILVALRMARAHGVTPRVVQAHGTSTELNNAAEIASLARAFRYLGHDHPYAVSAIKGLLGHSMGAASAVDLVIAVESLLEQCAPGLFNFHPEDLDPRFTEGPPELVEAARHFRFGAENIPGPFDSILITSEGFLSADAAAVLGRFPQEVDEASEMLRLYGFSPREIAEWRARAPESRARAEELESRLRGGMARRGIVEEMGYRPSGRSAPWIRSGPG
jgi:3-oxoacyl-(acyl-carrier-protein) synthase